MCFVHFLVERNKTLKVTRICLLTKRRNILVAAVGLENLKFGVDIVAQVKYS